MRPITVLSLFDGMACARAALARIGVPVRRYYAVELKTARWARYIADHNYGERGLFPGLLRPADDVRDFTAATAKAVGKVDLLVAGFPCQAFSVAGKMGGLADPRGALIYDTMRIIKLVKPRRWLLENVKPINAMAGKINDIIGVAPVLANSKNYGAQNRPRAFWSPTSFTVKQREADLLLEDILLPCDHPQASAEVERRFIRYEPIGKAVKLIGTCRKQAHGLTIKDRTTYAVNARASKFGSLKVNSNYPAAQLDDDFCRRLTVIECLRLMNLPDDYCPPEVPKTAALAAIGNGMDVAVVEHILRQIMV